MTKEYVGIIGGSGLYNMEGMKIEEERVIKTPYGDPSDNIMLGNLDGTPIAFLPRHGRGHRINPSEINYRANIYALKTLGVDRLITVTAVGSMKEKLDRGHVVIVDQLIDRTRNRPYTFFEKGIVAHVSFADPICPNLAATLYDSAVKTGATAHKSGTYVCIEGPMFSSRAESMLFRSWGVDVIGMTNYQEAKLAREAEICYATMAMVTDYDCWHVSEENVDALSVVKIMQANIKTAQKIVRDAVPKIFADKKTCSCNEALKYAIVTDRKMISPETRERLDPIIGKYIK